MHISTQSFKEIRRQTDKRTPVAVLPMWCLLGGDARKGKLDVKAPWVFMWEGGDVACLCGVFYVVRFFVICVVFYVVPCDLYVLSGVFYVLWWPCGGDGM